VRTSRLQTPLSRRRLDILRAAGREFRTRGYAETGMREIAAAATLSRQPLQLFFWQRRNPLLLPGQRPRRLNRQSRPNAPRTNQRPEKASHRNRLPSALRPRRSRRLSRAPADQSISRSYRSGSWLNATATNKAVRQVIAAEFAPDEFADTDPASRPLNPGRFELHHRPGSTPKGR